MQSVPPRARTNRTRIKPRRFHQNVLRRLRHARVPPTHHARQRQRLLLIGDHQVIRRQRVLASIQQLQPLARPRAPHHNPALNLVEVEHMRRLPHRQPSEVRRIHRPRDRLLPDRTEVLRDQTVRRLHIHIANHSRRKPPAQILRLDPHRKRITRPRSLHRCAEPLRQRPQRHSINRRRLARYPVVVHRIHAVRRNVHLKARSAARSREDALNRNAAQRQVFSELRIAHVQLRQIRADPLGQNIHRL